MYTIIDIAQIINCVANEISKKSSKIVITKNPAKLFDGMDSSILYSDFNWEPKITIKETIKEIIKRKNYYL